MDINDLHLPLNLPIKVQNAGLFISRGNAMHPTRIIDSHELIFVTDGELDMWEQALVFNLKAGDILHLYPGRQHGSTKPMPPDLRFFWIHFDVLEEIFDNPSTIRGDVSSNIVLPQMKSVPYPDRLENLFRLFIKDQETGFLNSYTANVLTALILMEATQNYAEPTMDSDQQVVVAAHAHTYIRMNYDRAINTSKIAKHLGYNVDYLGRAYKSAYGMTVTEAIHWQRIDEACKYLRNSELLIEQIATKCGFNDPDYFRRIFRRYMHRTPGDYRNDFAPIHVNTH